MSSPPLAASIPWTAGRSRKSGRPSPRPRRWTNTDRERRLLRLVDELAPDVIVITGDYLSISYTDDETTQRHARELLSQLDAPGGVYAISGSPAVDPPETVAQLLDGLDVIWLRDQVASLAWYGCRLQIVGIECSYDIEADEQKLDRLLAGHYTNPDNLRMANRLRKHRDALFTFLKHPQVDPTNNLAERQLRPAVIVRKLPGGNRTEQGAHTHEILATLAVTVRQQGISFADVVRALLTSELPDYHFPLFEQQITTQALAAR